VLDGRRRVKWARERGQRDKDKDTKRDEDTYRGGGRESFISGCCIGNIRRNNVKRKRYPREERMKDVREKKSEWYAREREMKDKEKER